MNSKNDHCLQPEISPWFVFAVLLLVSIMSADSFSADAGHTLAAVFLVFKYPLLHCAQVSEEYKAQ